MTASVYCSLGLHLRTTLDGTCSVCGDSKPFEEQAAELLAVEPPPGSVVMASGPTGTAWQRFASDGYWHSTTGKRAPWERLLKSNRPASPTRLVYLPPRG